MTAVRNAGASAFRGRACHDANAPLHLIHDKLEHSPSFIIFESGDLTSHAQRRDTVDAGADEQIHDLPKAQLIKISVGMKGGREDRIDAFKLQGE
jgi:hypothetical protein